MTLNSHDYHQFITTYSNLLLFTGKIKKIMPARADLEDFFQTDIKIKVKCRDILHEEKSLLGDYYSAFSRTLNGEEVQILENYKRSIKSTFVIFKCLARHTVFIDTNGNTFYAVHPLADRFENFFPSLPGLLYYGHSSL